MERSLDYMFLAVLLLLAIIPAPLAQVARAGSGGVEFNLVDVWVPSRLYGQLAVWMAPLNVSEPGLATTLNTYVIDEKGQPYYSYLFSTVPPLVVWVDPSISARTYSIMYGGTNPYSNYIATPGGSVPLFAGWDDFDYDSGFWIYHGSHSIQGSQLYLHNGSIMLNKTYTPGVVSLWLIRYGAYGTMLQFYSPSGYLGWVHVRFTDSNFQDWGSIRDGSDIYFTDANNQPLHYALPHVDLARHVIDALIYLDLSKGTTTIYMHYGGNNPYLDYRVPILFPVKYAEATPLPYSPYTKNLVRITGANPLIHPLTVTVNQSIAPGTILELVNNTIVETGNTSDGLVHLKGFPYGSIVRFYNASTGELVATAYIDGPVNKKGQVFDYALKLPAGDYHVEADTYTIDSNITHTGLRFITQSSNPGLAQGAVLPTLYGGSLYVEYTGSTGMIAWYYPGYTWSDNDYIVPGTPANPPFQYWSQYSSGQPNPLLVPLTPKPKTIEADVDLGYINATLSNVNLTGGALVVAHIYDFYGSGTLSKTGETPGLAAITVTNNEALTLYNYSLELNLDSSNFQDWNNLSSDGSDIYFTDANNNPLYYYIQYINTSQEKATIWVRIPELPANSQATIYMHYGGNNPYTSYNDPHKAFLYYEDFETGTTSLTVHERSGTTWNISTNNPYEGSYSFQHHDAVGTAVEFTASAKAQVKAPFIESMWFYPALQYSNKEHWMGLFVNSTLSVQFGFSYGDGTWEIAIWNNDTGSIIEKYTIDSYPLNTWYKLVVIVGSDGSLKGLVYNETGSLLVNQTFNTKINPDGVIGFHTETGGAQEGDIYADLLIVRTYASEEPSVTITKLSPQGVFHIDGRVSFIYDNKIYTEENASQVPRVLDYNSQAGKLLLDPSMGRNGSYLSLLSNDTYTASGVIERVPSDSRWVWVVENRYSDSYIHFAYIPSGTVIRLVDTSTGTVYKYVAYQPGANIIENYTITPPTSNPVNITISIPSPKTILPHLYDWYSDGQAGRILEWPIQFKDYNTNRTTIIAYANGLLITSGGHDRLVGYGRFYLIHDERAGWGYEVDARNAQSRYMGIVSGVMATRGKDTIITGFNGTGLFIYVNGTGRENNLGPVGLLDTVDWILIGGDYNANSSSYWNTFQGRMSATAIYNVYLGITSIGHEIPGWGLVAFLDPTFWNGTAYTDPFNPEIASSINGIPRVPTDKPWLWVVDNYAGPSHYGGVDLYFSYIPAYSNITITDSTGAVVWKGTAWGPVNKAWMITKMHVTLPPGHYHIVVETPGAYHRVETTTIISGGTILASHLYAWSMNGSQAVALTVPTISYSSPSYTGSHTAILATGFTYLSSPYTTAFGQPYFYKPFGALGQDLSIFIEQNGIIGFRNPFNVWYHSPLSSTSLHSYDLAIHAIYINDTAIKVNIALDGVLEDQHIVTSSNLNASLRTAFIGLGYNSIWHGVMFHGIIRYGIIYLGQGENQTLLEDLTKHILDAPPYIMVDPTFWNGTAYTDPATGQAYKPYTSISAKPATRILDSHSWIWTIRGATTDGLVHFKGFPYGSIIRLYYPNGTLAYSLLVTGETNEYGLVEDYTANITPGEYHVEALIPLTTGWKTIYNTASVAYTGSLDSYSLQDNTTAYSSGGLGLIAGVLGPGEYMIDASSPGKAGQLVRVWGQDLPLVLEERIHADAPWAYALVYPGNLTVHTAVYGVDGKIYLYYEPDDRIIETGLNYTVGSWIYLRLEYLANGSISIGVGPGDYPSLYSSYNTFIYTPVNKAQARLLAVRGIYHSSAGTQYTLFIDWSRIRVEATGQASIGGTALFAPYKETLINATSLDTWTLALNTTSPRGLRLVIPARNHTWTLVYNGLGVDNGALSTALAPLSSNGLVELYMDGSPVAQATATIPVGATLLVSYNKSKENLTIGYLGLNGEYHDILAYTASDVFQGIAMAYYSDENNTLLIPLYYLNVTPAYNMVTTINPTIVPSSQAGGVVFLGYEYATEANETNTTSSNETSGNTPYKLRFGLLVNGTVIYNYIDDNGTVKELALGTAKTPMIAGVGYDIDNTTNTLNLYTFIVWMEEHNGHLYTYWKYGYIDYKLNKTITGAKPVAEANDTTLMIDRFGLTLGWAMNQFIHGTIKIVPTGPYPVGGLVKYVTITGPIVVKLVGGSISVEPAPAGTTSTITLVGFRGWTLNLAVYGANINGMTITSDSYPVDFPTGFSAVIIADISSRSISIVSAEAPALVHHGTIPTGSHLAIPGVRAPRFNTIIDAPSAMNSMFLAIGLVALALASNRVTGNLADGVIIGAFIGALILLVIGDYMNMSIAVAIAFIALAYRARQQLS